VTRPRSALADAVRLLEARDLTRAELLARLALRGHAEDEAADAVARLEQRGFVRDARVAERAVELGKTRRGVGLARLRAELEDRGTDPAATETATEGYDERAVAEKVLAAKFPTGGDPVKAARLLAARGFDEEVVRAVVEARWPEVAE
jgi:regulatory protein